MRRAALLLVLALALIACSGDRRLTQVHPAPVAPRGTVSTTAELPLLEPELPRADRFDLARRLRGNAVQAAPVNSAGRDERLGERRAFWVIQTDPPRAFQVGATLRAVTEYAYFYVQEDSDVSNSDMAKAASEFEAKVYPTVTKLFGPPERPADGSTPRITILHVNLPGVGGYFTSIDQLPRTIARVSNERRMIYIDLRAGPPGTEAYLGVVAHELQHLIHHDRNPFPDAWLTEGLSELANEMVTGGGSYLGAYRNTPSTQLNDWPAGGNTSAHYGAAHSFLRYLLRHYGGLERARDLLAQGGNGVNTVQKYLRAGGFGVGFEDVFADWLVAGYLALPGESRFSNPGDDAKVRSVLRLGEPEDGNSSINQFGADFFEVEPRGKDAVFRFRGPTTVKQVPNTPAGGRGQWWSNRGDALDTTLTRELDLRGVAGATLKYRAWYDIERGYDYAYVTVSADGGTTWTIVRGRQTTDFNPLGHAYGPGYTGISGDGAVPAWVEEQIDLTPFARKVVLLRFEYVTDESAVATGFALDDIAVPEIGFADDAEQDSGWQASGFRRIAAPLPQRWLIQIVTEEGGRWTSRRVDVGADGTAEVRIPGDQKRAAVIVAGATYGTNLPVEYEWSLKPAGG